MLGTKQDPIIAEPKTIYLPRESAEKYLNAPQSVFHIEVIKRLSTTKEHLHKWGVGSSNGATCFLLADKKQVFNAKFIFYNNDLHRNKDKQPFYLTAPKGKKYKRCLYGLHLLSHDKIICLVESEKTAFAGSCIYPQFDWLATGSANGLTDSLMEPLYNREIYYLPDADKAGRENSTIKKLTAYKLNFKIIDLFSKRNDGYDLADALINGERPEIKYNETLQVLEQKTESSKELSKNISEYERVERFISDRYELRNNIVSNKVELRENKNSNNTFRELNENNIYRELQKNHINFSLNKLKSMLGSEFVPQFNPFVNYFENLPEYNPNSEANHIEKLCNYIPVRDTERFVRHFKKTLIRCISCSLGNTINKQAFILVHDQQNSGKSTFIRWLCPPTLQDYIAENLNTDKDSLIAMCTNFIINMDELATLNRAEINSLKSVMSKDIFKGRLPYGARETTLKRNANIFGSTNNVEFLSDETGSVRWLCFELTGQINFNYSKEIDINRIWAQAYHLYKTGCKFELTPEEIRENEEKNEHHRVRTPEAELIQHYLMPSKESEQETYFTTSTQIQAILAEKAPSIKTNINNIGKALRVLKFERITKRVNENDYPTKGYYIKYKI